jgi:hypothetical protein
MHGTATGTITGTEIDATANWDDSSNTHFTGKIRDDGNDVGVASGTDTGQLGHGPIITHSWTAEGYFKCTDPAPAAAPAPAPAAAPAPAPAAAPAAAEATVTADVDHYNGPNGTGGTDEFLPAGKTVKVAAPCTPDAWCNLIDPPGSAWGQFLKNN